jgi:hypothetical protein
MHNFTWRDYHLFGLFAAGIGLGAMAAYGLLRRTVSPDELERHRRELLVQEGRIIDGTVIDISDLDAQASGRPQGLKLILYQYEIAGVVYECSQDVTLLAHLVNIHDCRPGFPVSVRYAPRNPGNSLVVAETWSGLRNTAQSIPFGRRSTSREGPEQHASQRAISPAEPRIGELAKQQSNGGRNR